MASPIDTSDAPPQLPPLLTPERIRGDYMNEINSILDVLALAKDMRGERPLEEVFYELLAEIAERAGGGIMERFSARVRSKYPEHADAILAQQNPDVVIACDQIADVINSYYKNRTLTPELCKKFEQEVRDVLITGIMPLWVVTLSRAREDYCNEIVDLKTTVESCAEEATISGRPKEAILKERLDEIYTQKGTIIQTFQDRFPEDRFPFLAINEPQWWTEGVNRIVSEVRRLYAEGQLTAEAIQRLAKELFALAR